MGHFSEIPIFYGYCCTLLVSRLASLKAAAKPVVQLAAHRVRLSEVPST